MSLNAEQRHYGGPKARANHAANPDNRLQKLLRGREGWGDIALARLFIKKATSEELEAVVSGWIHNRRDRFMRVFEEEAVPFEERIQQSVERAEERAAMATKTKAAAGRVLKSLISLDFIMPNGKPLGKCTFGYATEIGGKFAKIGAMGKPNQIIGKVLTQP